jgi:hypothetical protein
VPACLTALILALPLLAGAATSAAATTASTSVIPGQWIAKIYSEGLGRAPDPAAWANMVTHFTDERPNGGEGAGRVGMAGALPVTVVGLPGHPQPDHLRGQARRRGGARFRLRFGFRPGRRAAVHPGHRRPFIGGAARHW